MLHVHLYFIYVYTYMYIYMYVHFLIIQSIELSYRYHSWESTWIFPSLMNLDNNHNHVYITSDT